MQEALVAVAEGVTVLVDGRGWYGRDAEARMVIEHRRTTIGDVAPCGLEAVVCALLIDRAGGWHRRRGRIVDRPRVRTARQQEG